MRLPCLDKPQVSRDQNSYGLAINAAGEVVGLADTSLVSAGGPETNHAFLWTNGVMTDLGTLGGVNSEALSINATGQIVGDADTGAGRVAGAFYTNTHAFLWSSGVMKDLNQLIPPGSGWFLAAATPINDSGQIVGVGTFNGQERAFLLSPR
jgi:probable HAF family extracellular repeat protein